MYIIKADGKKQEFDENKIVNTCIRAGVPRDAALKIAKKISMSLQSGATTHTIHTMIVDELDALDAGSLFMLRESVANLDPESFEIYVKKILEAHGYKCQWNKLIKGKYVEHQVDVIAVKEKHFVVECKRHFNPHRFTGLGICLQVQARLEDIIAGNGKNGYDFNAAWVVTNTKFSDHAKNYAKGIGIRLTGWRYENEFSLENLIQSKKLLPITLLKMDVSVQRFLLKKKIITVQDLLRERPKVPNLKDLISQSNDLLKKL